MSYVLGIDISHTHLNVAGSSFTGWTWSPPEPLQLGAQTYAVPAVLQVAGDGTFTVGDQAAEWPVVDGRRIARGFVSRTGDEVPQVVAGEAFLPHTLTAVLVSLAVERVHGRMGEPPEHLVISHPATWGDHRGAVLRGALWDIGLGDVTLLPAPVAAGTAHAWRGFTGRTLGVLTMCGSGFEASVVRRQRSGFSLLGCHDGSGLLGGDDLDEALATLVRARLGREFGQPYLRDPQVQLALLDLAVECARARPALLTAAEIEIPARLPTGLTAVPVGRAEFDDAVRPMLRLMVDTLRRTARACGLRLDELDGVLVTGVAAQFPQLVDLIGEDAPGEFAIYADPQPAAAPGAALVGQLVVAGEADQPEDYPSMPSIPAQYTPDHDNPAPPRPPVRITKLRLPRSGPTAMFANARVRNDR